MPMMRAEWYFDFVSPFAYLQWQRLRGYGDRVAFDLKPVLLAGLLDHHGTKGPAEVPAKRAFTYRFVRWHAARDGIPLRFPPAHPFNPLAALRLCIAAGCTADAVDALFAHFWRDGRRGDDAESLAPVAAALGIDDCVRAVADPAVKEALTANFDDAVAAGVFGVPTIVCGGQLFWGVDATPMFDDWLAGAARFDDDEDRRLSALPIGAARR